MVFNELEENELFEMNGGFAVSLGFTIAVCLELFLGTAAYVALEQENKRLEAEMAQ